MSIKSVLVHVDASDVSLARLQTSFELCEKYQAHLTALCIGLEPAILPLAYGHADPAISVYMDQLKSVHEGTKKFAEEICQKIDDAGILGEARGESATIDGVAPLCAKHAQYADLAVIGQPVQNGLGPLMAQVQQGVLFDSGVATIVHPAQSVSCPGEKILIAWDGRREAALAVRQAMPFLEKAKAVELLLVDPKIGSADHGQEPGADLALMLSRHGIEVTVQCVPGAGQPVSQVLLNHARDWGADMIVMGAYGHSRFREFMLGGTTREMLHVADLPLLVSSG